MARSKQLKRLKRSLPTDIVIEVFYLLPVMSLLRCKSVCKYWLSIIEDPEFIKIQMAKKKSSLFMISNNELFKSPPQFPCKDFQYYLRVPVHLRVVDETFRNHSYLWNPSIMQSMKLAKCPDFFGRSLDYDHDRVKVALGFDSISDEYKVLRFIRPDTISKTTAVPIVEIYSTGTDSWEVIKFPDKSPGALANLELGPFINGVLHMKYKRRLVSFDLHSEVFTVISFPSSKLIKSHILDFESSVAVIFQSKKKRSRIRLWTLEKVGGEFFWIKKFNIVYRNINWVYSYLGDGLFYGINGIVKKLYDYRNCKIKSFPRLANAPKAVFKYTETLLP
ncbi:putative F-box protein At3g10240 [Apium graveolens]|uniref:putative F-box protein At3g10240 n=1 Tax=Apium graveolens TaxID=4045 RepID=UPI003D79254A